MPVIGFDYFAYEQTSARKRFRAFRTMDEAICWINQERNIRAFCRYPTEKQKQGAKYTIIPNAPSLPRTE
jgi:hypothetical protein